MVRSLKKKGAGKSTKRASECSIAIDQRGASKSKGVGGGEKKKGTQLHQDLLKGSDRKARDLRSHFDRQQKGKGEGAVVETPKAAGTRN